MGIFWITEFNPIPPLRECLETPDYLCLFTVSLLKCWIATWQKNIARPMIIDAQMSKRPEITLLHSGARSNAATLFAVSEYIADWRSTIIRQVPYVPPEVYGDIRKHREETLAIMKAAGSCRKAGNIGREHSLMLNGELSFSLSNYQT